VTGTSIYNPPEISVSIRRGLNLCYNAAKADLFALGATLFVLIFNEMPFG